MANTKERIYNELFKELANDTECVAEIDQMLKYMSDYFNTSELAGFLEYVKEERGVNNTIEDDGNDEEDS